MFDQVSSFPVIQLPLCLNVNIFKNCCNIPQNVVPCCPFINPFSASTSDFSFSYSSQYPITVIFGEGQTFKGVRGGNYSQGKGRPHDSVLYQQNGWSLQLFESGVSRVCVSVLCVDTQSKQMSYRPGSISSNKLLV